MPARNRMTLFATLLLPLLLGCDSTTGADATSGDCTQSATLTIGSPLNGSLATSDCKAEGAYEDNFTFTAASATFVKVTLTASNASEFTLARGTAADATVVDDQFSGTYTFYAALPAGTYGAQIASDKTGSYTINISASTLPSGCFAAATPVYLTRGSSVSGAITNTDCVNNSYYGDPYRILMASNTNYSFTATGSMGINVEVNQLGTVLAHMNTANNAAGSVTLPYRPTATNNYNFDVLGIPQNTFGNYSISVQ